MTSSRWLFCITACVLLSTGVFADDARNDLERENLKAKELAKAMQRAQLLLSDMSAIFECEYQSYDVSPRTSNSETTYLVVIDVKDNCVDMVTALNDQGAKDKLHFVSEQKLPEMKSMPESGPVPFDERIESPMDYSLIHEVDPEIKQ